MKQIIVQVRPGASHNKIEEITEGVYKVHLTAQPVGGEANKQLVKILAKHFRVAKSLISIKTGKTAKTKTVTIAG